MTTLFVRHTVKDYAAWRKAYDEFKPVQKQKGVMADAVYQAVDNSNDVTVTHEFANAAAAQNFMAAPELKKAMEGAGVVGAPTVWLANKA